MLQRVALLKSAVLAKSADGSIALVSVFEDKDEASRFVAAHVDYARQEHGIELIAVEGGGTFYFPVPEGCI